MDVWDFLGLWGHRSTEPPVIHPHPSQSKLSSQTGSILAELEQQKAEEGTRSPKSLDFSPCCWWEETQITRGRGQRLINETINQTFVIPGWMQVGIQLRIRERDPFPVTDPVSHTSFGVFFGI